MNSVLIAGVVFACAIGGAVFGLVLRAILPKSHLESDSKEVITVTTGLLATLAALVLGLLVASAKAEFDEQENGFRQLAASILALDRMLALYGPDADPARMALRRTVTATVKQLWPTNGDKPSRFDAEEITDAAKTFFTSVRDLAPHSDAQRVVQEQALQLGSELARMRWLLSQQHDTASSIPFLVVLMFWLTAIFASFGLFAPINGAVVTAFFVCALSTAGAIFLIDDLNRPADGVIHVSSMPLRYAVAHLTPPPDLQSPGATTLDPQPPTSSAAIHVGE